MGVSCSVPTQRILLLGMEGSGKTTLLYYLKLKKFQRVLPTIGLNEEEVQFNKMNYNIIDLSELKALDQMLDQTINILCLIDPQGDAEDQEKYLSKIKDIKDKKIFYAITKGDLGKIEPEKIIQQYNIQLQQKELLQINCQNGENIQQVLQMIPLSGQNNM